VNTSTHIFQRLTLTIQSTFRATIWINGKYHLFQNKIILNHESYFQPSLEEGNNFRWQADVGLELPIWKFLSFKINYRHTFESIVIENQNQEDRFLTFGLTLKSY
jgi:putative salt-induced outer membrane protein YdiY